MATQFAAYVGGDEMTIADIKDVSSGAAGRCTVADNDAIADVDALLNRVFQIADRAGFSGRPRERFKLFLPLLGSLGQSTPGYDPGEVHNGIAAIVGDATASAIYSDCERLGKVLSPWLRPTYSATSYWSPCDSLRHTVVHTGVPTAGSERRNLANAYLFYALTFEGASAELYSAVQFLAVRARRKYGVRARFEECSPDTAGRWWIIPPMLDGILLSSLGISEAAARLENSSWDLEATLHRALANEVGREWSDREGVARELLERMEPTLAAPPGEASACVAATVALLTREFEEEITSRQATFMLATHLLWRRACRSRFMYTYPVEAGNTCVLTIGSSDELPGPTDIALGSISKSLFIRPLLLDYSAREAEAQTERKTAIFRHLLSHNIPKLLFQPANTELVRTSRFLNEAFGSEAGPALTSINRLRMLFKHYERFLVSILVPRAIERDLDGAPSGPVPEVDFHRSLEPVLDVAFDYLRSRLLDRTTKERVRLSISVPEGLVFRGHQESFLTEVIFNLLSNAIDALDPAQIARDAERGVILLTVIDVGESVVLSVIDRGGGFRRGKREFYRTCLDRLENAASKSDFWEIVEHLIDSGVKFGSREEHMGIGLIFCGLYVRWLEWQVAIGRRGAVRIDSQEGEGASVSVTLPMAAKEAGYGKPSGAA